MQRFNSYLTKIQLAFTSMYISIYLKLNFPVLVQYGIFLGNYGYCFMMDTIFGGQNGEDCGNRLHGHDAELFGSNESDGSFVVQLKQL